MCGNVQTFVLSKRPSYALFWRIDLVFLQNKRNKLGIKVCNNAHYTVHNIGQNSLHSLSETSGSCEAVIMHHQIFEGKNKGNIYFLKIAKVLARHGQSSITSPWARQLKSN